MNIEREIEQLLENLKNNEPEVFRAAIRAFGTLKEEGIDLAFLGLAKMLDDANPFIRERVVYALTELGDKRAIALLIERLNDHEEDVLEATVGALTSSNLKDERAIVPLIEQFPYMDFKLGLSLFAFGSAIVEPLIEALGSPNPSIRWHAAYQLGNLRDHRAVDPLIGLLHDENPTVRGQTIASLGWLGDKRAIEPLCRLIQDREVRVREGVANALGRIGDPSAIPILKQMLNDEIEAVREAAQTSLGQLGDQEGGISE